jgi:uncharacterized protein (DUF1778 family)
MEVRVIERSTMLQKKTKRSSWQESLACLALKEPPAKASPVLKLNEKASVAFAEFLLNPQAANQNAKSAADRYKAQFLRADR